jgi:PTH1 family peptidyl-tRNA hydrolase
MADSPPTLLVGLGNPGPKYDTTRHNVGFMVIDALAEAYDIRLESKSRFDAALGRGRIEGHPSVIAKPLSYMNRSGIPTQRIAAYYRISSKDLIVIHDDIDLAYGRIKIKEKGGHGGHNGLKSLIDAFGNGDFTRLRIGIGRPETGDGVTGHVLGRFHPDEQTDLNRIIRRSREAAVSILCHGAKESMNVFNRKDLLT